MAARKSKSIQSLGEKALAEAKGGSPKKTRKKATKKSSSGPRKKASASKETGKLRDAVRVVNEARRLLSDAGCSTSANAGRPSKKRTRKA